MPEKSRQEQKVERDNFREFVASALSEAHTAAKAAFAEFDKQASHSSDGRIEDVCGTGYISIRRLSERLRLALAALGEVDAPDRGEWSISDFSRDVPSQSLRAHEAALVAARKVLEMHLSEEAQFVARTRVD